MKYKKWHFDAALELENLQYDSEGVVSIGAMRAAKVIASHDPDTKNGRRAWLIRQRDGKAARAIFFCGKDYIPDLHDGLEAVRCEVIIKVKTKV